MQQKAHKTPPWHCPYLTTVLMTALSLVRQQRKDCAVTTYESIKVGKAREVLYLCTCQR